jgi:hypothetical protein
MSYADELLELSQEIANLHPEQRHQSSLRRAVFRRRTTRSFTS